MAYTDREIMIQILTLFPYAQVTENSSGEIVIETNMKMDVDSNWVHMREGE